MCQDRITAIPDVHGRFVLIASTRDGETSCLNLSTNQAQELVPHLIRALLDAKDANHRRDLQMLAWANEKR